LPHVALRGVDLWVERHGHAGGPPIVLLHGLGSSSADWTLQLPALAARHRVLAVDLRGHGRSRPARGLLTVDRLARDVAEALAALGEPTMHVVGLSLGGCVGLALASREPGRVRSLTVVNAFAKLRPAGAGGALRTAKRFGLMCVAPMTLAVTGVARGLFPRPEQHEACMAAVRSLASTPRRTYLNLMLALAAFDARARLGAIRCPTLVVAGDRDRTVPRAAAEALAQGIPNARLVVIPDSGHATPHDQPAAFSRTVLEFVGSAAGGVDVGPAAPERRARAEQRLHRVTD
jgi:pimeloyl-ACP methyl ester carboxylesterase